MAAATIFNFNPCAHFRLNSCIQHRICNIPTKFGENLSNSKEIATVFHYSRWRQPTSQFQVSLRFLTKSALHIRFVTFPLNLVRIGLIIEKWQQLFRIQDGGRRHIELYWM